MEYKDYYQILGIGRDATQDQIKQAYRKLARKYHPDVSKEKDAEARFKDAGEAYEVLKDPEKRAAYDKFGANWRNGDHFEPPPNWDAGFEFRGAGYTGGDASGFSDFFESLFGHDHATGRRQQTFRGSARQDRHPAGRRLSRGPADHHPLPPGGRPLRACDHQPPPAARGHPQGYRRRPAHPPGGSGHAGLRRQPGR